MDMEDQICGAAKELGRLSGFTTAGALMQIAAEPGKLDSLIDAAAEPHKTELMAVKAELQSRIDAAAAAKKPAKKTTEELAPEGGADVPTPPTPAADAEKPKRGRGKKKTDADPAADDSTADEPTDESAPAADGEAKAE